MRYEIEIDSSVIPDKMRPARFGIANIGDAVLFGPLVWGHTSHSDDNKLFLILEPIPAAPEFDAGTFWRWDCHQDGLKPSIVRIATKGESATNCISPRAYEAAVIFPDGLAFIVYRSSLTPWIPQPGERAGHGTGGLGTVIGTLEDGRITVRWDDEEEPGSMMPEYLIPAAFAPKPKPEPELHKFCPYCGKVADEFFWVCAECAEESRGNFPTAHGEIQPSASPPSPLLPKPWAKKPEPAKEQPPTLPDGWELADPEKRLPKKGEWYLGGVIEDIPSEAAFDFCEDKHWIIRRKAATVEIDIEQIISIFATAESGLGTIAGMFGTLSEQLRKLAEGKADK